MADEQDRLRAEYQRLRRSGLSEEEAASRLGLNKSRGVIQEAGRGLALGGAEAVTGLGAGIGWLGRPIGLGGLEEASLAARERAREALDPRGKAGAAGRLIGRIGGEAATTVATAGLGKLGAARLAPQAAEAARAAMAGSRAARAAAVAAPDIALSAPRAIGEAVTGEGEIDKALLAQNLALELAGSALGGYLATRGPSLRIAPETDPSRMIPATATRDSRLRGAIMEDLPEGVVYGPERRVFNETAEDIVERATKEGATPLEKRAALRTARNAIKREKKLGLVPAIEQRVDQRVAEEFANRFGERRTFGFKELDRLAKDVNIEDLKIRWGNGQRLSEADTQALFRWTTGLNDAYEAARRAGDETAEDIMQEMFDVARIANTESSRAGLTLRQLQEVFKIAGGSGDDLARYRSALAKSLGVSRFGDLTQNIQDDFVRLLKTTDPKDFDNAVAEFAFKNSKSSWKDVILDSRRAGLISGVGSWVRNILGSTEAAIGTVFMENPMAAAIDKFVFSRGKEDVFAGIGSFADLSKEYVTTFGKTFGKIWKNRAKYFQGVDPEQPLDILKRKIVNYESVSPKLKMLEKTNNFIYGVIAGGDKPFYEAALNRSLRERALLRAAKDPRVAKGSVKIGTDQFDNIVRSFMDPETAVDDDVVFAIYDALNATFKNKTGTGEFIRKLQNQGGFIGTLAEIVVPFPNTPTNIVRKALERVPGLGFAVGKSAQKGMIAKHVNEMRKLGYDITDQGLENQLRRLNAQLAAKQITGTGLVAAGYLLAKNGSLTPAYTPFIGRTPEEREEARRQGVTGETALSIKLGDRSYNIASLGTFAPLLAMGAALAIHDTEESQPIGEKIMRSAGVMGMSALRTLGEMPLLTGARDIVSTFEGGGYARPEAFGRQAATFIPLSGAVGSIARAIDPAASRQPRTVAEGFMERIPLARQTLAPRTTALGEVVRSATPVETLISPFGTRRVSQDPLYEDLRTIGFYPSTPTQKLEGETQQEFAERRRESGSIERERLSRIISNFERRYGDVEYISEDRRERLVKSLDKALRDTRSKQTRRAQRVRARRTNE